MPALAERKDDVIQIRTSREAKALFVRAADLRHQKLSEFMLESAKLSAQDTILNHCLFALDDPAYEQFAAMLDHPPEPSPEVVGRFRRAAPWTK
jgi:uncharacterized protein (DUF1778 family)